MKFKSKSNKIFNPITLEIVIETKEELAHMWALFNCSTEVILESGAYGREKIRELAEAFHGQKEDFALELFREINMYAEANNII